MLFSDLVGSTAMSRDLDAEDFRDMLNEYQAICRDVVTELDGYVAQYLGDGVMVYFGYPEAHEDDARRATQAGLRIVQRVKSLTGRLNIRLVAAPPVRIGIHTGVVLMDRVGVGPERLALGEVPNLAARLQQLAEPDDVVISHATSRLVEGFFRLESLGDATVKGFDEPIAVYRVTGSTGAQGRVDAIGPHSTPLIAREEEAASLAAHWETVIDRRSSRLVLVSGEPGIGKSRLVQAFKQRVTETYQLIEGYCSPFHENTALRPIAQALEASAGIGGSASAQDKFDKLQRYLHDLGLGEATALLASVLSIPVPEGVAETTLAPQVRRQRTMRSLLDWIHGLARKAPLLFLIEDLQWADPSTLELLGMFVKEAVNDPAKILATHRPEFVPPWSIDPTAQILLQRLSATTAEQLICRVAQGRALPSPVIQRIIELTDGIPLYLEEVTKSVLESGALRLVGDHYELQGPLPEGVLPASLRDSLVARLDRLAECKPIAQLASTIGREFSYDVLHTVALVNELTLHNALDRLTEAGLMLAENRDGARVYRFKHALIQEAAYQSLLKRDRQQYHHRVASVLRDQFPEVADAQPDLIAQHHAKASLPELAATYFERAGKQAFGSQAYAESINHFQNAVQQTLKLPTHARRDSRELELLSGLGLPLLMTKGYAADEVRAVYDRALTLCTETYPSTRILYGVWAVQIVRGDKNGTERMAAQFAEIAKSSRIPAERFIALLALGTRDFWRGDLEQAIRGLGQAVAGFDPKMLTTLPLDYGLDNPLYAHLMLSWAQFLAGRIGDGQATWEQAWSITEAARSPYLSAMALSFGAALARDLGDIDRALDLSQKGIELSATHQLVFWLALAQMQHGSALCHRDDVATGIVEIEQGLQLVRLTGVSSPLAYYLCYHADACLRARAPDKGLASVEEGLKLAQTTVDRMATSELLRLKGELLLQRGDSRDLAESFLREAVDVAVADGAGLWELRAATSLARVLSERGEPTPARRILAAAGLRIQDGNPPLLRAARDLHEEIVAGG